ncbi:cysteine hydrolase family protein [Aquibacillus albus]|uniref:Ureidoacrylate peracid hydrolase n=1 Tax=Aquibacillus albus TaxID=1168171 RepID=A0ABS2MWF4_9BACI|nr:isochorismatase family cysteine hydrolase [Aquibacillus albus]MBM7570223.1 ureidoacrylate peracid hydrolase [Aquibacillus albus]
MSDWKDHVDLSKSALVIIDVQNDFCHERGAAAINGGDVSGPQEFVPRLKNLIEYAHASDIPVFFVGNNHDQTTNSKVSMWRKKQHKKKYCETGSWGAKFYGVQPTDKDIVIVKHRYSAFIRTDLELRLRAMGCESLLMTGVATSTCVESTLRHGFMLDFHTILVKDCTANNLATSDAYDATLYNVERHFGWISDSEEICTALEERSEVKTVTS